MQDVRCSCVCKAGVNCVKKFHFLCKILCLCLVFSKAMRNCNLQLTLLLQNSVPQLVVCRWLPFCNLIYTIPKILVDIVCVCILHVFMYLFYYNLKNCYCTTSVISQLPFKAWIVYFEYYYSFCIRWIGYYCFISIIYLWKILRLWIN